ncbi:MAG: sensor histidine kinase [Planctomycetes bacterium]|nr:sensor histidine kinase [Planctomycetota bacterium]
MRALSLASRFLITLVVSAVLPLLVYGVFSLRSMREQIDEQVVRVFLPQLAADYAQKIEAHLDRTDQACAIVREIARRALDEPGELEAFEEQVELVPDLLDNYLDLLLLADSDGRVVYWQDGQRLDPSSHGRRAALIPRSVADTSWFRRAQQVRGAVFLPWGRSPYLHRGLDYRSMDPGSHHLGIALDVPRQSGPPGVLFALLRWSEVQLVVDGAREVLVEEAGLPSAEVFLIGRDGIVEAHTDRRHYGLELQPPDLALRLAAAGEIGRCASRDGDGRAWRVGYSPGGGHQARSFVVGVAVPESELFAASDAFERVLWIAIVVTLLVLGVWSLVASRAITAPVAALVRATRRIAHGDLDVSVPARGGPELGELATAFNQMANELMIGRERLAHAERDQAWAEMARQVAHEVKNPLQPMRMVAQLLQRARNEQDPRAADVADRLARTVLEQTAALDRIASDFRSFAGIAPAQRAVVAAGPWLHELVEQTRGLFAGKPVTLALDEQVGDVRVDIDRAALARVLVNLVQNAHEAAHGPAQLRVVARRDGGRLRIEVVDDGPGVPADVRLKLFDPYFTTKSSGTGLGLAICRRLVEVHGGTIRLVSTRPGETTFAIELPVATR